MAINKFSMNIVFGAVAAVLAITAGTAIYRNLDQPGIQEQTPEHTVSPASVVQDNLASRVAALEQLASREPQNPEYPTQIGNLYYDNGQYAKAIDYYQRSLRLRPRDPNVETDLATCFHYLGQDDKALEVLDSVLGYNPRFIHAKFNKGIVLIEGKKDVKGGIAVWEDLLRTEPSYGQREQLEQRIQQLKASLR